MYNPNTGHEVSVKPSEIEKYNKLGYIFGVITRKGKLLMSKDNNNILVDKKEIETYKKQGYKFGR